MIYNNFNIEYFNVNYRIYNNSFINYINFNNLQINELLTNDSYLINPNPTNDQTNDDNIIGVFPVLLYPRFLQALTDYEQNYRRRNSSGSDSDSDSDSEIQAVEVQPIRVNPNQIRIEDNPGNIQQISFTGPCVVCGNNDEGGGWCRINCGHIGHCSCFTSWINTHTTYINYDNGLTYENEAFYNNCPVCRSIITSMIHIHPPQNNITPFGKNKKITLISIKKDIKYLNG
jgi:hypothetical protein